MILRKKANKIKAHISSGELPRLSINELYLYINYMKPVLFNL